MLEPSSMRLVGAVDVLHPEDWSDSLDGSPSAFLTTSRSRRLVSAAPRSAPWRPVWSQQWHLMERDFATHSCSVSQGSKVACAPEMGGAGRGGLWPLAWEACALTLQDTPECDLHIASHCVLLTEALTPASLASEHLVSVSKCVFLKMHFCFVRPS